MMKNIHWTLNISLLSFLLNSLLSVFAINLFAAECKLIGSDAAVIVGKGQDESAAFQDAATQCFDDLAANYNRTYHSRPPEDRVLDFIDSCVNRTCQVD